MIFQKYNLRKHIILKTLQPSRHSTGKQILLLILLIGFTLSGTAQQDTATSDGLFQMARKAAFEEKNYSAAKNISLKALAISPDYTDIKVFLGRLYAWSKDYDSSKLVFSQILAHHPDHLEATLAFADLESWYDHQDLSLKIINNALEFHPESKELLLRKAKNLYAIGNKKEALSVLQQIKRTDSSYKELNTLEKAIRADAAMNQIGISYDYVHFDNNYGKPWSIASLDYKHKTNIGPVIARINYANRFAINGVQFEADAYPHLSKTFYTYVNVGYSNNSAVFPHWRGGFSLYANLPHGFESDLGWRYLYFSSSVNIYTAYLGKYFKNYLFGLRTYLTPSASSLSQSYSAIARYYFHGKDQYVGISLGTGISPDDRALNQQIGIKSTLKTNKLAFEGKFNLGTFSSLLLNASLVSQENYSHEYVHQLGVGLGAQRRF